MLHEGIGEGDVAYERNYTQAGDAWSVKSYGMGVTMDKQEAQFGKLLGAKCK